MLSCDIRGGSGLEWFYNASCPHSALGGRRPREAYFGMKAAA